MELVTGANASSMILEVYNKEKEFVCALTNDNSLLGSFPIDDGMRIHVHSFLIFFTKKYWKSYLKSFR